MQVRLFARPEKSIYEWTCFADVTNLLWEHMKATNWAVSLYELIKTQMQPRMLGRCHSLALCWFFGSVLNSD